MSGIVLSASVRQNLLSLQSTADLLATTQNRLSTGKKVNTALDNPTNLFTAAKLDNRASDINNLLDGIGNGVQVLQAANTGITSLQKLVDSAKSVANQALQTQVGYSSKSSFSVSLGAGAIASDLFAGGSYTSATLTGAAATDSNAAALTAAGSLTFTAASTSISATILNGDTLTVDGHTITFKTGAPPAFGSVVAGSGVLGNIVTDGSGNSSVYLNGGAGKVSDLLTAVDLATGVQTASNAGGVATIGASVPATGTAATVTAGKLVISTGTAADLAISSSNANLLASLGIGTGGATTSLARTPSSSSKL